MVVGALTHCALLHIMCDLKAVQIDGQHCLIWEHMLNEFELGYNAVEATKNIYCVKNEGAFDYSTVTRWFKKFCLSCKNFDNQAKSGRPKTVASEAVL